MIVGSRVASAYARRPAHGSQGIRPGRWRQQVPGAPAEGGL